MASRSLNKVMLIGNLTRDPELRYTPQGTAVCNFGVATNRSWTSSDGQRQEEAEFHRIVAWQKLAELCSQLLFKGRKVYLEGRLQTRKWQGSDGQNRQTTEVVIDTMIVLDRKRRDGGEDPDDEVTPEEPDSKESEDKSSSDSGSKKSKSPSKDSGSKKSEKVSPDDIPF